MSFLPQDYKAPEKTSRYMKFKQGINRFRILSPAIVGYEYWTKENKPVRSREEWEFIPQDIKLEVSGPNKGMPTRISHFWSFVVWNYEAKEVEKGKFQGAIQILHITQSSIQSQIKTGIDLRKGNATNNDIGVNREGEGFDTEYSVQFADPSPVPAEAEEAFKREKINLDALFTGEDPFGSTTPTERGQSKGLTNNEETEIDVDGIPF